MSKFELNELKFNKLCVYLYQIVQNKKRIRVD